MTLHAETTGKVKGSKSENKTDQKGKKKKKTQTMKKTQTWRRQSKVKGRVGEREERQGYPSYRTKCMLFGTRHALQSNG